MAAKGQPGYALSAGDFETVRDVHTVESVQHARVRREYLPVLACEACLPVLAHTPCFL
jgi:hypothetical protein